MKLQDWIKARREIAERATKGRWQVGGSGTVIADCTDYLDMPTYSVIAPDAQAEENAKECALHIADAHNSQETLLKIIEIQHKALWECGHQCSDPTDHWPSEALEAISRVDALLAEQGDKP